ncbi:hypothetical protein BY996DRAFT_6515036 [Phakopsora pachyrhizi]|nr:hypothetical protein BY996DRAFT_6515036 [Phakopsora pachyrhizi]
MTEDTICYIDNSGLHNKIKYRNHHSKAKYLDAKAKWITNKHENLEIKINLVRSEDMIADSAIAMELLKMRELIMTTRIEESKKKSAGLHQNASGSVGYQQQEWVDESISQIPRGGSWTELCSRRLRMEQSKAIDRCVGWKLAHSGDRGQRKPLGADEDEEEEVEEEEEEEEEGEGEE